MRHPATLIAIVGCGALLACNRPESSHGAPDPQKVVMDNGLTLADLSLGADDAPVARKGKLVTIHYTGWLQDETTVVDSTRDRQPLQFQLGEGTVLKAWDLGIPGMRQGGKRKLWVPPALGFGPREFGPVKPGSPLVFEIELVDVR